MSVNYCSIADGVLSDSKNDVISTANGRSGITYFVCFNNGAGSNTVRIYFKRQGQTSRQIVNAVLATGQSVEVVSGGSILGMSTGDVIEGDATTASEVTYVVTGFNAP